MLQTISFFSIYDHYMTSYMYTALVPNQRIVTLHDLKTMNVPVSIILHCISLFCKKEPWHTHASKNAIISMLSTGEKIFSY